MILLKFILLLFLIFLNFIGCFSVNPIPSEYNCLSTLIQDYNLLKFTKDGNNQYVDICTTANTDIVCTTSLGIKTLVLNSGGTDNILDPLNFANCFPQMEELIVKNLKVTPDFIYYKFPVTNTVRYSNISGIIGGITQPLPAYRLIELFSNDLNNTIFRMQYLDKATYSLSMFSSDIYLYLNTDGANSDESSILANFGISVNSISDLSSYKKLKGVTFKISPRFDYSTFSLLKKLTITDQSGNLIIYDTFNQNATLDQYIFDNSIIPNVYISALFKKPNEYFDITLFKNHTYKYISLVPGASFNINGSFPLIVPKNIQITFIGGSLTVFPNNLNFNPDITTNFQNSIKSEQFPPFLGSGGSFDFTGSTKFIGTIDKSWCTTEIALSLGNLTGLVPSCFACYFNVTKMVSYSKLQQKSMMSRFASNNFSNFNKNTPCTTFRPKVELINDGIFNKVMVTGNDIGFDVTLWKINLTISLDSTTYVINQNGKNYTATMVGANNNLKNVEYFPVLFTVPNNVTYTFPTNYNIPPIIKSVKSTGNQIQVSGTHFSSYLEFTNQQIQIQNVGNCSTITSSDFFGAQCTMESGKQLPISNSTIPLQIISIEKDSFNVKAYIKIESNFDNNQVCPNDCSTSVGVNSICDLSSGTCKCLPGFVGSDCLGIECSVPDCSGNGNCNTTIGECICDSSHRGSDCSILFIECDPVDCNSNGVCDTTKGECNCKENSWSGPTCLIPYHYITSTIPSTTNGGVASFIGFFGDTHNNLSITIGNLPCPLLYNSTTVLNCTAPPGFGIKVVVVTQNNITYSYNKYQYLNVNNQTCPNKCSNQGTCNPLNGQCKCNNGFNGADCSGIINPGGGNNGGSNSDSDGGNSGNPPTDTGVDPGTGNTTISNQEVQFQIFFKSLYEIDFNGNISQRIQSNCSIISKIEEITNRNGKEYTFADETFNLQYGSIKFNSISISLDLPHCIESCIIDPDFSVLISPEFKNECGNSKDGRKSYVIPVAVVASVVGVSTIGAISYLIYRRKINKNFLVKLKQLNNIK
ncbi:hypothetical protein ACTFIW_004172 [Dictyostelium discoideum]